MGERFGKENPFMILVNATGHDHFDGVLYDVYFNTRMVIEWHELQEKEQQKEIPRTQKEMALLRRTYEDICYLYGHEATGKEDVSYMLDYLREYFELYDKWEGEEEYRRFKEDRWHRTKFPDGIIIDKSIW